MFEELENINQLSFYSDLVEAGGLGPAIQAQLKAIGSPVCVKKADQEFSTLLPFHWEVVQEKERFSQIKIAKHHRLFMVDFWDRGVYLAHASTPMLPKVAEAINAWIAEESSCGELRRRFPLSAWNPPQNIMSKVLPQKLSGSGKHFTAISRAMTPESN